MKHNWWMVPWYEEALGATDYSFGSADDDDDDREGDDGGGDGDASNSSSSSTATASWTSAMSSSE